MSAPTTPELNSGSASNGAPESETGLNEFSRRPPKRVLRGPAYWRNRATQARASANAMADWRAQCILLDIAESYDRLAEEAERRLRLDL